MRDRTGFFAACADSLSAMCAYWFLAGVLITGRDSWGVALAWPLLCAAASAIAWAAALTRPRSTAALTALAGGIFAASLALLALVSSTPLHLRYLFMLAIGAGMAAGVPLYHTLHRPTVLRHLKHLDAMVLVLAALLLVRQALGIGPGTAALMAAVLLLDAAGAVGLRMSDGVTDSREGADALRGTLVALAAAAGLAVAVLLLTAVFSRSGGVTEGVLGGIGAFFSAVGGAVEGFFRWLTRFASPMESDGTAAAGESLPSLAGVETQDLTLDGSSGSEALGLVLCAVAIAAVTAAVVVLRKKRFSRQVEAVAPQSAGTVRRRTGAGLWRRLMEALRFRWTAFVRRDTPEGLLIRLERLGKRRGTPRRTGESMRQFICRMDESGGLDDLADALDRTHYGGGGDTMSARRCRALRKTMRRTVRHG